MAVIRLPGGQLADGADIVSGSNAACTVSGSNHHCIGICIFCAYCMIVDISKAEIPFFAIPQGSGVSFIGSIAVWRRISCGIWSGKPRNNTVIQGESIAVAVAGTLQRFPPATYRT